MIQSTAIQKTTACNRDCPDACSIIATIEDGRVTRLQGDKSHPITQGFLCQRTSRFLERQYSPDRLTTPLRRVGDRFVPISWGEALDFIAARMIAIRAESGAAAIMHYRCGGSMGILKAVSDYYFERFGPVTEKSGDVCTGAGDAAQSMDFGDSESHDIFDLENSKTVLLWGKNLHVGNVHLLPILKKAQANGTKLISIDPIHHKTADFCDQYIQPRPGGDAALAFGMARVLIEHQLHDPQAATYCDHFEEYVRLVMSRSVSEWSEIAGVAEESLVGLARDYGNRPASLQIGWGMQRRRNGTATVRALDALGAISGNIGIPGGGVYYYYKRRGAFDTSFAQRDAIAPRLIPEPLFGKAILEASDPPIRMMWIDSANPVAMLPDSLSVAKALESRELTVVVDSFLTDSARCAHIVLPTTTLLEEDDLLGAYGHHWIAESRPVIDPPAGIKSDYQIIQELAKRTGLESEFADDVETWKRRVLRKVDKLGASLDELRQGAVRNPLAPKLTFRDRKFATASGKVNLIHQWVPSLPTGDAVRPLLLMALSTEKSQAAQWPAETQIGPATAIVHPEAAQGFSDGEIVQLESELTAISVRLKFDHRQRTGIVLMEKGGWLSAGRCANALIPGELTDAGGCAVYYDTPVRILASTSCST